MTPPGNPLPEPDHDASIAAGRWLARRDRGFTAGEQDAFSDWLAADPRHRAAFRRLDRAWSSLDSLAAWQPAESADPNPDLLAPGRARRGFSRGWFAGVCAIGAAAAVAALVFRGPESAPPSPEPAPGLRVIPEPEKQFLVDGSLAEINHGSRLEVDFRDHERRLRLRAGEVHLSVVKDAARPFVVEVDGVLVRAVGTAFNVRRDQQGLEVLVTEGAVEVARAAAAPVRVTRGERARIEPGRDPVVTPESPGVIAQELAWRGVRLEFEGTPLRAVVAEFNLRNSRQLVIGDAAAGRVGVSGTFRADEPEAFARLLEAGFGLTVERLSSGAWVLNSSAGRAEGK